MMKLAREQILELNEVYSRLLELSHEKTAALKGKDYDAISAITEKEQEHIDRAKALEEERMKTVAAMAQKWGVAEDKVTAQALIAKCGADEADAMRDAVQALTKTLAALRAQNEINSRLLEIKMRLASFILEASREAAKDPGNYYNNDGTELQKEEPTHPRFIDSEI